MPKISQLILRPSDWKTTAVVQHGETPLTPLQLALRQSLTASQLVDEWSGTLAQINVKQDIMEVASKSNIPTLADVTRAFDNGTAVTVIANHLHSLCSFGDTTVKQDQFLDTALLIATEYYFLNLSELCLFFRRCKIGKYGQIVWGQRLNIQQVMTALYQFVRERAEAINKRESQNIAHQQAMMRTEDVPVLMGGLDELHEMQKEARKHYSIFRKIFPRLPPDLSPQEYWAAWKQDENRVGRILSAFCMRGKGE